MDFYRMLAQNYDEIFPFSDDTFNLIMSVTPSGGCLLDIGSATGKYLSSYRKNGINAFGLEYCPELIKNPENTVIGDMTHLPFGRIFDTAVCTGNTLAHAEDKLHAEKIVSEIFRVLKSGGKAVIQILNYEMILSKKPANLPQIDTDRCSFVRKYDYEKDRIKFTGLLKSDKNEASSAVHLYPITPDELTGACIKAGFKDIALFGSFSKDTFDRNSSLPLIALMSK